VSTDNWRIIVVLIIVIGDYIECFLDCLYSRENLETKKLAEIDLDSNLPNMT
jgi:hypothetical protein